MSSPIIRKLNVRCGLISLSLILMISGICFVGLEIKDNGSVDIKAPFITGTVKSGLVGITLLFFSVILCGLAAFISSRNIKYAPKHDVELSRDKNGKWKIKYSGQLNIPSDWGDFAHAIHEVVDSVEGKESKMTGDADVE